MNTRGVVTAALVWLLASSTAMAQSKLAGFVTRDGDKLLDAGREYRFISFNIPNLHYVEDDLRFDQVSAWRLPDAYEVHDALATIVETGGRVARMYALSVRRPTDDPSLPRYVTGPGAFNEEAFRALDLVLKEANDQGVRVIVPFVDQWSWWGGIAEYAGFRGKAADAFWTDPQVIADFKQTIAYVLNRKNTLTGVVYKDDPAVLAWETGNELSNPPEWRRDIAAYIKSLDPKHLVIDGLHAGSRGIALDALDDPNIDIISTHHYPDGAVNMVDAIAEARRVVGSRKAYLVGEYGFVPTATIQQLLDQVITNGASGALIWSLRIHSRDGGFYWHAEPAGGSLYKAYHWPGFPTGDAYDERVVLKLLRQKAYEIRGEALPELAAPAPPVLLPAAGPHAIRWQGSVGATGYDLERSDQPSGPWTPIGLDVDESAVQYNPRFCDPYAMPGSRYFYRVRARRGELRSEPSNVIGPIGSDVTTIVDELIDASRLLGTSSDVRFDSTNPRRTKEDTSRINGPSGAWIAYRTRGPLAAVRIQTFFAGNVVDPFISMSSDGQSWSPVTTEREGFYGGRNDYDYDKTVRYTVSTVPAGQFFVRVQFGTDMQIGRVEIDEGATSGPRRH